MSDTQALNIGQRMMAVCRAYGYLRKEDRLVDSYRAISYDTLIGTIRQHIIDAGILILPVLVDERVVVTGKETSKKSPIVRLESVFDVHFCNSDDTNDRVTIRVPAHAEDYGDKAAGKATTYAVKSAIVKGFMIESGNDEESRVQGYSRSLTTAERTTMLDEMKAATSRSSLRDLARAAMASANEVGDEVAYELFKDEANKLAPALPDDGTAPDAKAEPKPANAPMVAMPVAKAKADVAKPEPGMQERTPEQNQDADPPPVAEAVKAATAVVVEKAKRGAPASAGMVKMLDTAVGDRKKMRASILAKYDVKSFAEMDRDEIKGALAKVLELTKPAATA